LQIILDASSYGFSWNHSDAYSCIGYVCGFLRHYHPLEFLTAAFNTFTGKEDKIVAITKYANKVGIKIQPPKFRYSRSGYQMNKETNSIYKGLESIKYLNAEVSESLYEMRDTHFDSFIDFLNVSPLNSRQLEILVKLDFFKDEFGGSLKLLKIIDLYNLLHGKKQIKKEKTTIPTEMLSQYCISETEKMFKFDEEHMDAMLADLCGRIQDQDIPLQTKLKTEQEMLGYISHIDPSRSNTAVVMDVNCKYTPKLTLYCLDTGSTMVAKLKKKSYENNPLSTGAIIKFSTESKPAWKKDENGGWIQDYSRNDVWITNYSIDSYN
jgi:DNA polymerase III alpha subunit